MLRKFEAYRQAPRRERAITAAIRQRWDETHGQEASGTALSSPMDLSWFPSIDALDLLGNFTALWSTWKDVCLSVLALLVLYVAFYVALSFLAGTSGSRGHPLPIHMLITLVPPLQYIFPSGRTRTNPRAQGRHRQQRGQRRGFWRRRGQGYRAPDQPPSYHSDPEEAYGRRASLGGS